jgi:hypothetical protein
MELNMYNGGYDYEEQVTFIPLIEECEGEYPENNVKVELDGFNDGFIDEAGVDQSVLTTPTCKCLRH